MTGETSGDHDGRTAAIERRIARAVFRARAALAWEIVWREAAVPLGVVGLFVALAWLGVFAALGPVVRAGAVVLLAAAVLGTLVRAVVRVRAARALFDRRAALARIERASGLRERELSGYADRLPDGVAAVETQALWAAHRRRLAARLGRTSVGWPHPDLGRRDRWALRPALGMALFVGWFAASGDRLAPLTAAFRFDGDAATVNERFDAWIDPPAYTGLPAIVLTAENRDSSAVVSVPAGSRLVVRAATGAGGKAPRLEVVASPQGAARPMARDDRPSGETSEAGATQEQRLTLAADADVAVLGAGREVARWHLKVVPDLPPRITLAAPPTVQGNGTLRITHDGDDDWGVISGEAEFALPPGGRALVEAPHFPLTLPPGRGHRGRGETLRDLSGHPLAGARLMLRLTVRDGAGQQGASVPVEATLPERRFRQPLARALVELRRRLALDAGARDTVATALDGLLLAPEHFEARPGVYLALHHLARAVDAAPDDAALREVLDGFWTLALMLDLGDVGEEAKALRAAQDALREALQSGASEEEIARLTKELRTALDAFLKAQAEAAQRDPRRTPGEGPGRTVTKGDLDRMLDRIEKLGRTGSRDAAQQLLSELDDIVGNLRPQGSAEGGESGPLDALSDLMRKQRKLMEETHRGDREGGDGEALQREQQQLRRDLGELADRLGRAAPGGAQGGTPGPKGEGGEPGKPGPGEALGEAGEAMGEAGEALKRGDGDGAVGEQGRALEAMRRGARALADQMRSSEGKSGAGEGRGDGEEGEDPLGRPRRSAKGGKVGIPEEIDVERARRVLEDIRRRLADPQRPRLERDYLDRLLKLD
jgi:uncharacterized protein (TIGR02302 family)